jgi:hypothetical protein
VVTKARHLTLSRPLLPRPFILFFMDNILLLVAGLGENMKKM